jgi:hypothetical protein
MVGLAFRCRDRYDHVSQVPNSAFGIERLRGEGKDVGGPMDGTKLSVEISQFLISDKCKGE